MKPSPWWPSGHEHRCPEFPPGVSTCVHTAFFEQVTFLQSPLSHQLSRTRSNSRAIPASMPTDSNAIDEISKRHELCLKFSILKNFVFLSRVKQLMWFLYHRNFPFPVNSPTTSAWSSNHPLGVCSFPWKNCSSVKERIAPRKVVSRSQSPDCNRAVCWQIYCLPSDFGRKSPRSSLDPFWSNWTGSDKLVRTRTGKAESIDRMSLYNERWLC